MQLPNFLTFLRIGAVVPFVFLFYVHAPWASWALVGLFLLACLTDYFDGYFARLWKQESRLGAFLDPMADKLLVATALLMLTDAGQIKGIHLLPAVVILCREILVSGLREFLAEIKINLPVNYAAKWKTGIQMLALSCLLFNEPRQVTWMLQDLGVALLWCAAALTLVTGHDYLRAALRYFSEKESPEKILKD